MADFGVSEGIALAGVVASVAATSAGAVAASNAANYNKKVAENNATAAMQQASYANQLKQMQLEKTIGAERAAAGASGVVGGSLDDVEYNTLVMGKLDQLGTTYEAKVQGTRASSEAQLDSMQSQNSIIGGGIGVLGDAAKGASNYQNAELNQSGVGEQPDMIG